MIVLLGIWFCFRCLELENAQGRGLPLSEQQQKGGITSYLIEHTIRHILEMNICRMFMMMAT